MEINPYDAPEPSSDASAGHGIDLRGWVFWVGLCVFGFAVLLELVKYLINEYLQPVSGRYDDIVAMIEIIASACFVIGFVAVYMSHWFRGRRRKFTLGSNSDQRQH